VVSINYDHSAIMLDNINRVESVSIIRHDIGYLIDGLYRVVSLDWTRTSECARVDSVNDTGTCRLCDNRAEAIPAARQLSLVRTHR